MYCTCTADITLYNAALQRSYAHGIMSFGRHGVCISGPLVLHEKCCAPVQLRLRRQCGCIWMCSSFLSNRTMFGWPALMAFLLQKMCGYQAGEAAFMTCTYKIPSLEARDHILGSIHASCLTIKATPPPQYNPFSLLLTRRFVHGSLPRNLRSFRLINKYKPNQRKSCYWRSQESYSK